MQHSLWYGIGVLVLAGAGVAAYMSMNKAPAAGEPAAKTEQSQTSLRELAASASPQKCTFTSANNTQGTVYVAQGRVRGDFSAQVGGAAISGHMVVKDNTSYVWTDTMSQGFKNSFDASAQADTSAQGLSPDERVSYSCSAWSADESLFALPAGVTFMSISEMQVKAGAGAMGASCGQCNQIPDANAKAQCLAALHC